MAESFSVSTETTAVAKILGAAYLAAQAMEASIASGGEPGDPAARYAEAFRTIYRVMTESITEKK